MNHVISIRWFANPNYGIVTFGILFGACYVYLIHIQIQLLCFVDLVINSVECQHVSVEKPKCT